MKIGLLLPQGYFNEFEGWQPVAAWERILEIARLGERLGFDAAVDSASTCSRNGTPRASSSIAVTLAHRGRGGGAAGRHRVRCHQLDVPEPGDDRQDGVDPRHDQRRTSDPRARRGFKPSEASAFGVPFPDMKERLAMLGEHFEIISRMTRRDEAPFTFEGQYARVEDVVNAPTHGRPRPHPAARSAATART